MRMPTIFSVVLVSFCMYWCQQTALAADPNDIAGSSDPALFSRMPGFHIYRYEVKEFDRYEFTVGADKKEMAEGFHVYVVYDANEGITQPSGLQITQNYVNAAKSIGGGAVYEFEDGGTQYATIKVTKDTKEVWAEVSGAGNGQYILHILEKQPMKQTVTANAEALSGSIKETGKVAVYGIYFDTDKAVLKPESDPVLAEIAKMLKSNAGLNIFVVGHTDNAGYFNHNIKLSQERAAAVVSTLINKHGIAATRLTPFGVGPVAPIASNKDEAGRSKNRRVELVAK